MEFVALANHRKSIRSEIARYAELFRAKQAEVLAAVMEERGIDTDRFPPVAVMTVMTERLPDPGAGGGAWGSPPAMPETRALVASLLDGFGQDVTA